VFEDSFCSRKKITFLTLRVVHGGKSNLVDILGGEK